MAEPKEECITSYDHIFNANILKGKVAFVTGGGSGIGFTIVEILMRHGCDTVIASRSLDRLKDASRTLEAATGRRCLPVQMDVRKPQDIINAVEKALGTFNRIDILVNNAAGNFLAPVTGLSFNAYRTVLEIDTFGTFNVSKVVYEKYLRDHGGVVINITATLPYRGTTLQAHAGSAKAAIDALTKHFAVEWGPDNVRVIGVAPGPIMDTEGARRLGGPNKEALHERMLHIPLQRAGTRAEIGHLVLFLVSRAGSLITGETIVADGGAWMGWPNSMYEVTQRMREHQGQAVKSRM